MNKQITPSVGRGPHVRKHFCKWNFKNRQHFRHGIISREGLNGPFFLLIT